MSFTLLGILQSQAGGPAINYWLTSLDSSTTKFWSVATDSADNIYAVGEDANRDYAIIAKWDKDGTLLAQRRYTAGGGTSAINQFFDIAIDSSDNIYIAGETDDAGADNFQALAMKLDTDLNITWQREYGDGNFEDYHGIGIDSNSDIYFHGRANSTGRAQLNKYNSAGVLQFQKYMSVTGATGERMAVDSSNNVYTAWKGSNFDGLGNDTAVLTKWNSSGVVQWHRCLGTNSNDSGQGVTTDADGNVYFMWNSSLGICGVMSFDSSGNSRWQNQTNASTGEGKDMKIGPDGYLYTTHPESSSQFVIKWDTDGNVQWQRKFSVSGQTNRNYGINFTSDGAVLISGEQSGSHGTVFKFPADGSLTGTYSLEGFSVVYEAGSSTIATNSDTITNKTDAETTGTLDERAESGSFSTPTYATETVALG